MATPKKFRKKPVEIEAIQITQYPGDNADEVARWCYGRVAWGPYLNGVPQPQVLIATLEGMMTGNVGDWIIRGIKGEFYPCKPDIFEATYEPVD